MTAIQELTKMNEIYQTKRAEVDATFDGLSLAGAAGLIAATGESNRNDAAHALALAAMRLELKGA